MGPEKGFTASPSTPAPPVATLGQLWQVPLFLLGLVALAAVWLARPLWYDPEIAHLRSDLARARSLLQEPHAALHGLTVLLNESLSHIDRLPDRAGETHFLLGSTYLRLAEQVPADRAADLWQKARSHLEEAEHLGVPDPDRAVLLYRLGKAWYHTGGDLQRIIANLGKTIDLVDEDRAAGYEILTQCYLRLPIPNVPAALQANAKQLQLPTSDASLVPARLMRGELLLRMQQREEARRFLVRIGPDAPPAIAARARYLRARSYQEEEAWAEAAKLWEEVLADRRQPPTDPGRVLYYLGWCYRNLRRPSDAARFWERAVKEGGEEGQAASVRLANLRIEAGNIPAALTLYESALGTIQQPADYRNSYVNLVQASNLLASDCRVCKDAGKFAEAAKLAQLYGKLVPPGPARTLLGQVMEAWAFAEQTRAPQIKDPVLAKKEEQDARSHFRDAATAYQTAADATAGQPEQGEWLWHAAACSMQGQDFEQAVTAYKRFIDLPAPAARLSEAWYRLGEAQQALHQDAAAEASYTQCIATNGSFAYRARYQLAAAEISRGKFDAAEEMLEQIRDLMERLGVVETEREAHEKTLYALADLLFLRSEFYLAATRWEQALLLYPANPAALTARYRRALCYRKLAEREHQNLHPSHPPDTQPHYRRLFASWLEMAAAQLHKVIDDLQARQAVAPLTEADATLLRHARFLLADCRFHQGLFTEAIPLYIGLANECHQHVEGLVALRELYFCYSQLTNEENRTLALHTLKEIRQTLNELDDAAFQNRPEMERRAYWEQWLQSEEARLKALGLDMP